MLFFSEQSDETGDMCSR